MRRSLVAPLILAILILLGLALGSAPNSDAFVLQPAPTDGSIIFQAELPEGAIPFATGYFVRLLRITLESGAVSPPHLHPGLEVGVIESGVLSVTVEGPALLSRATSSDSTPVGVVEAPLNEEFRMRRGDMIAYLPQTGMTFRNAGQRPVKILATVIQPAGNQAPPGIQCLQGSNCRGALEGVTADVLGDGVATRLPNGRAVLTIDRLQLEAGEPVPAFEGPIMLSVNSGVFDFTITGGCVQISRTADPGASNCSEIPTFVSLSKGDAAFFTAGMQEAARSAQDGELQFYRLTIVPASAEATPEAQPDQVGVIAIATPSAPAETPTATAEPTNTPAPEPTEEVEPTATEQTGKFKEGDVVQVTEDGVRLRSGPSTEAEIVTGLNTVDQLTITGPSEEGNDLVWWPVRLVADENVTGYVAEDFLELVES